MDGEKTSEFDLFSIQDSWQQTPSARSFINSLLKKNKRKQFGKKWTF